MKLDQAVGVDLRSASLCIELDCNTIFDGASTRHCPRCGSDECYPLAVWLDRATRQSETKRGVTAGGRAAGDGCYHYEVNGSRSMR